MRSSAASRMKCPPSVTKAWPSVARRNSAGPGQPAAAAAASTARRLAASPNGTTSTGRGIAAEHRYPFQFIGDHDEARGCRGDDLFPQQRAATALDQVQIGRDLVGAIDREVELGRLLERGEGDAEAFRIAARHFRRRHGDHLETSGNPRSRSSTKCFAVEPLPSPSRMPGLTNSRARAAAARFEGFDVHRSRILQQRVHETF